MLQVHEFLVQKMGILKDTPLVLFLTLGSYRRKATKETLFLNILIKKGL